MLTSFHKQLIRALSDEGADFILIGSHAALVYGSNRTTGDMDLLVKPDKENGGKVIRAFLSLKLEIGELIPSDFEENIILGFGLEPDGVEIINHLKSCSYQQAAENAIIIEVETGLSIPVIDVRDLLAEKRLLNRLGVKGLSDQIDILNLEAFLENSNSRKEE